MKLKLVTAVLASLAMASSALAEDLDLRSAKGTVLIAAPTAINGPTNQGIWFVSPGTGMFSLELPALPSNQVYEGWIVNQSTGTKVSTGLFQKMGAIDSDAAGRFAGPLALNFPAVPGSDFVTLGEVLTDGNHLVVVTVEPYPDFDLNPSNIAVLRASIPVDAGVGMELTLENVAH